jgi:hypothetical protein
MANNQINLLPLALDPAVVAPMAPFPLAGGLLPVAVAPINIVGGVQQAAAQAQLKFSGITTTHN